LSNKIHIFEERTRSDIQRTTHFLNVDLDLHSMSNLQPLVTAMGEKVYVLHIGRHQRTYHAHLELASCSKSRTADSALLGFCALIRTLPKAARRLWDVAKVRDFNIGVQAAPQPDAYEIALTPETVKATCKVNARIVLTVYAPKLRRKGTRDVTLGSRAFSI
jgi:hypothetical protein